MFNLYYVEFIDFNSLQIGLLNFVKDLLTQN